MVDPVGEKNLAPPTICFNTSNVVVDLRLPKESNLDQSSFNTSNVVVDQKIVAVK